MNEKNERRDFIRKVGGMGVLGIAAAAGIYYAPSLKSDKPVLRPPAAVKEEDFLKLCIKCGQCLQVCPYDSILLEDIDAGASMGMACIKPLTRGCYLCEAFPCILACPTGALDHEKDNIKYIHMGIAVIVNESACLAQKKKPVPNSAINRIYKNSNAISQREKKEHKVIINGNENQKEHLQKKILTGLEKFRNKECTICADMCPFHPNPEDAIGMIPKNKALIPQIREACVGCGVCVELCPTQVLNIIPHATYEDIYKKGKQDNV